MPCMVHTFDCTFNGSPTHERHKFHHWCIGHADNGCLDDLIFLTLSAAQEELGHDRINVLKVGF